MLKYRPEVDGLRAVAVLPVLLYHAGLSFPGGFAGVDVFFVISGYLITSIIRREALEERFELKRFWERRIRRIIPASLFVVICSALIGYLVMLPSDWSALLKSAIANALMVSNIHFWQEVNYFSSASELMPMLHTWSLAVEEQFYLVLPFVLWGCTKLFGAQKGLRILSILALLAVVISFGLCIWQNQLRPEATFYLLPTRAWELGVGMLIALFPQVVLKGQSGRELFSLVGLAFILVSYFLFEHDTVFPGISALLPVLGAGFIIWANGGGQLTLIGRLLARRELVGVGLISYSLYLWHWPILAYLRYCYGLELSVGFKLGAITASFALAIFSYYVVELPFRRRLFKTTPRVYAFGLISLGTIAVMGFLSLKGIVFERVHKDPMELALIEDAEWNGSEYAGKLLPSGELDLTIIGYPSTEPDILLWGDSHALVLTDVIDQLGKEHGRSVYVAARGGVPPLRGLIREDKFELGQLGDIFWNDAVWEFAQEQNIKHIFLVACWSASCGRGDVQFGEQSSKLVMKPNPLNAGGDPNVDGAIDLVASNLSELIIDCEAAGIKLTIMRQVPEQPNQTFALINYVDHRLNWINPNVEPLSKNSYLKRMSPEAAVFEVIVKRRASILGPLVESFFQTGELGLFDGAIPLYKDSSHLSRSGTHFYLRSILDEALFSLDL